MILARVKGNVVSTEKHPCYKGHKPQFFCYSHPKPYFYSYDRVELEFWVVLPLLGLTQGSLGFMTPNLASVSGYILGGGARGLRYSRGVRGFQYRFQFQFWFQFRGSGDFPYGLAARDSRKCVFDCLLVWPSNVEKKRLRETQDAQKIQCNTQDTHDTQNTHKMHTRCNHDI